jgi:DNA-binding transcriptional LysR family regulator
VRAVQHPFADRHNRRLWQDLGVELDLRQVRAFVAAAEHGHFGRASQSLFLTQQALSKRIAGLEAQLGVMFDRGPAGVSLTERGERFLPAAYRLLEAADDALATGLGEAPAPLRVDVWGPIDPPESAVRAFAVEHPDAIVEVSMRRNLPAALAAVTRNELDVAVGNLANLDAPLPDGLSSRLVAVTEAAALVYELGQLARADTITPDDLRGHGLAVPVQASRREFANFVTEYAEALDVPLSTKQRNTDLDGLIDRISADPDTVTLVPAGWPLPQNRGLRLVPIRPAPLFPWHAVWRAATAHPLVPSLIRAMHDGGGTADLADAEHWLPAAARQLADVPLG